MIDVRQIALLFVGLMFLSGCATTDVSTNTPTPGKQVAIEEPSELLDEGVMSNQKNKAANKASIVAQQLQPERDIQELNQQIVAASMHAALSHSSDQPKRKEYRVGPGDVLEISVFRIEDLNKKTRVTGDGYILLPLLGGVPVGGKTTQEIQAIIVRNLAEKYLHDPQVTVFISEFKSHQVAVLGAVNSPDIYTIQRPRTVMEMLSKAGGLTEEAGAKIRVQRVIERDGVRLPQLDIIDLRALLDGQGAKLNFTLAAGDSVMVPKAGVVFVEGAVTKPGAYPLKSQTNVLKALAMAGGARFEAKKGEIQIFRQASNGDTQVFEVDLNNIRANQSQDVTLEDGDIVVVLDDALKKGFAGFWRGISGILSVGTSL